MYVYRRKRLDQKSVGSASGTRYKKASDENVAPAVENVALSATFLLPSPHDSGSDIGNKRLVVENFLLVSFTTG